MFMMLPTVWGEQPTLSLLLHMNGANAGTTFPDSTRLQHSITAYGGAQTSTTAFKFNGSSGYFNGTNAYLGIPASNAFIFGTGKFAVEAWVNPATIPSYFVDISGGGAGGLHTAGVKSDGTLWTWGLNDEGQLGLGDYASRAVPTQVGTATNWRSVSCGRYHTLATKTDGTLWAWGFNTDYQVGNGGIADVLTPLQIGTATDWNKVAAGGYHSLAIKNNGTLWSWGWNEDGQLGRTPSPATTTPTQVGTATDWLDIAGGRYHTIVRKTNGTIYSAGYNGYGELGQGDTTPRSTFTQIGTGTYDSIGSGQLHCIAVRSDGTLWTWGYNAYLQIGNPALPTTTNQPSPYQVGTRTDWKKAIAGGYFNMVIDDEDYMWTFGDNGNQAGTTASGQLGTGSSALYTATPTKVGTNAQWSVLSAGRLHAVGVKSDGSLWTWGDSEFYQLGNGSTTDRFVPTRVFATDDRLIFGQLTTAPNFALFLSNKSNALSLYRTDGNIVATNPVNINVWSHVAATRDEIGTLRLFINGNLERVELNHNVDYNASTPFYVGGLPTAGSYFSGYMAELRVHKGKTVYRENFTPPPAPF